MSLEQLEHQEHIDTPSVRNRSCAKLLYVSAYLFSSTKCSLYDTTRYSPFVCAISERRGDTLRDEKTHKKIAGHPLSDGSDCFKSLDVML
jgi:hypothetical protein